MEKLSDELRLREEVERDFMARSTMPEEARAAANAFLRASELAEAYEAEVAKRIESNTDWYQQRFDRLRAWVLNEVKPLSEDVAHRYFAIVANGSPAPHESADWTNTMHSCKLKLERAEKRTAELEKLVSDCHDVMATQKKRVEELERWNGIWQLAAEFAESNMKHLQSQLAWTPVGDGLPTEPGVYEFSTHKWMLTRSWKLDEDGDWLDAVSVGEMLNNESIFDTPLALCEYTHYRRIELPEAT